MPVSPSKQLALRRKHYNATVTYLQMVHEELMILRVRPDFEIPPHKAGQYTVLGLGYWEPRIEGCQEEVLDPAQETRMVKRAYSLSAPILNESGDLLQPEEEDYLEFYIVLVREAENPPGFTPRAFCLEKGSRLFVGEKITGRYTLDGVRPHEQVVFMATGTGEAPHNKMLLELLRNSHEGPMASITCARYGRDLGYLETHRSLARRLPQYSYFPMTTREPENEGRKVYIQDLLRAGQLNEMLQQPFSPSSTHVFLCGNPGMIGVPRKREDGSYLYPNPQGAIEILESQGFKIDRPGNPGNIHFEEYW